MSRCSARAEVFYPGSARVSPQVYRSPLHTRGALYVRERDKIGRVSTTDSDSPSALERFLAFASLSIIAVALLSFFVTLIIGLNDREAMASGWLPIVYGISIYALPVGFILLVALLIITQRRRKREAAQQLAAKSGRAKKPRK